jgi:hypothetical protein
VKSFSSSSSDVQFEGTVVTFGSDGEELAVEAKDFEGVVKGVH